MSVLDNYRKVYGEKYFRTYHSKEGIPYDRQEPRWIEFFTTVARRIRETLNPGNVLDVGCAKGFLVEALRDEGISAYGMDVSEYALGEVRPDVRRYVWIGSVTDIPLSPKRKYNLVTCIEVLEHLPPEDVERAVREIIRYSHTILFSSTPDDFEEPTHLCVRPPDYWRAVFDRLGFYCDLTFDARFLAPHAMLFRRRTPPARLERRLRVLLLLPSLIPSVQVRLLYPLTLLAKEGCVQLMTLLPSGRFPPTPWEIGWADVVILSRVHREEWLNILRAAKQAGKHVIYDLDDNLVELPEGHPEWVVEKKARQRRLQHIAIIREVDALTVSTLPLARSLKDWNKELYVLPNYLNLSVFGGEQPANLQKAAPSDGPVVVGYAGSRTHGIDFAPVSAALQKLMGEWGEAIGLRFIGYFPPELGLLSQVEYLGQYHEYWCFAQALKSSGFDIGLAPLAANGFNDCKSSIKFLEYAICGIPGIYSAVTPYRDIVEPDVTGILVKDHEPEAWYNAIHRLLQDPELRHRIAYNAYHYVRNYHSLEDHCWRWLDIYEHVLNDSSKLPIPANNRNLQRVVSFRRLARFLGTKLMSLIAGWDGPERTK